MNKFIALLIAALLFVFSTAGDASGDRTAIHAKASDVQPVLPGMMAPDFMVRDVKGREFRYKQGVQERPIVLTFYRGGWCPYCNLHLSELRLAEEQ